MAKHSKAKRRHHHVWQRYLKPWTHDGAIWCRQDGRTYSTGTRSVAVETDFYKLQNLSAADIALVRLIFSRSPAVAQESNKQLLTMVQMPFKFAKLADQAGDSARRDSILAAVDHFAAQALEDYHMGVEAMAAPLLARALQGDLGFYEDDEQCISFLYFLATQYLRTKGIKERSLGVTQEKSGPDLSPIWNLLIHMFAHTLGCSLFLQRRRAELTLVRNETDTPFVTGDQPLINLHATHPREPVDKLSIYYPIAPTLALIIPEPDQAAMFPATGLDSAQAAELNTKLAEACHRQVFAQTRESLEALPVSP